MTDNTASDSDNLDCEPFRYTEAQWQAVVAALPEGVDLDVVRSALEGLCGGYLHVNRVDPVGHAMKYKSAHKMLLERAVALQETWRELPNTWEEPDDNSRKIMHPLYREYCDFVQRLRKEVAKTTAIPTHKVPKFFNRDWFVFDLINGWARHGGNIGTSVDINSKSTGPLVKFLVAAVAPVLDKPLTHHAAREVVRKFKRQNLLGDCLIDLRSATRTDIASP